MITHTCPHTASARAGRAPTIRPHVIVARQIHQVVRQHAQLGGKGGAAGIFDHAAQQEHGISNRGERVAARHAQHLRARTPSAPGLTLASGSARMAGTWGTGDGAGCPAYPAHPAWLQHRPWKQV